jgi:hypothetical protein
LDTGRFIAQTDRALRLQNLARNYCAHDAPSLAIQREKNMKHWPRAWKLNLINSSNPKWRDLTSDIFALNLIMDARDKPGMTTHFIPDPSST